VVDTDSADDLSGTRERGEAQQRNLILGLAEDLEWEALRPFVESLRQTGFEGEVRLFTAGASECTLRRLREHGVIVHRFFRVRAQRGTRVFQPLRSARVTHVALPPLRAVLLPAQDRDSALAGFVAPISVPHVARYLRYYRFLSAVPTARYENVMLTDVADVYFQRSPFDFGVGTRVNCFLEDPRETLASEPANRYWLVTAYGEAAVAELGSRPISCSGVTIGPFGAIVAYLRVMANSLMKLPRQHPGIDQAVHNYVIHMGLAANVNFVANGEGPVLTLGIMPPDEVAAALPDGYADVPILHQYDRHPQFKEILLGRLVDR
jgi:hypothetical protein